MRASCTPRTKSRAIPSRINFGVSVVRNRLLDLADGDAVAFLDADDTWEPSHLLLAVGAITLGADLVVAGVRTIDLARNAVLETISPPSSLVRNPALSLFRQSVIVTSSAVILKRSLALRVGHFDPNLRIGEDRDYWLRCALTGARFHVTRGYTCNYSQHPASSMARTVLASLSHAALALPLGSSRGMASQSLRV